MIAVVLIESAARPIAESPREARGLWQFIPQTARRYGLVVDQPRDERLDTLKAIRAAARYFWMRTTLPGILTAVLVWLLAAYTIHYLLLRGKASWLAQFTGEGVIKAGGLTAHIPKCSLVSLLLGFLLVFSIMLLLTRSTGSRTGHSYWKALTRATLAVAVFPVLFCFGAVTDKWLELTSEHLQFGIHFAAGETPLLDCEGSYLTLAGVLLSLVGWVTLARGR